MRTIVAGGRGVTDALRRVSEALANCGWTPSVVLSGGARGVDAAGEAWAAAQGIPVERYPADWSRGRKAGPERNKLMAAKADALVAVWDGQSRGTASMMRIARESGLRIYCLRCSEVAP